MSCHTHDASNCRSATLWPRPAAGQAVNLASRIQGMACGGQVVVSQPVVDSVRFDDKVDVVSLGPATVKGVARGRLWG